MDDAEFRRRHAHRRDVGRAALQLAVPAMTLQRKLRFAGAFVSHRLAQAAARSRHHFVLPRSKIPRRSYFLPIVLDGEVARQAGGVMGFRRSP